MFRSIAPRALVALALLGLLALTSLGCNRQAHGDSETERQASSPNAEGVERAGEDDADDLVPVEAETLVRGPIEEALRFSTNLEAESAVEVFSQAARLVTELRVEEGDRVRAGEVLLRLQDDEQKSAVARAESQLRKAEREYERQRSLFEQELIPEQTYNDSTYELEQRRIALDDARRELGYATVHAPIGGTVTQRLVNLGDNIQMGQHLFDLVDFDTLVARVFVPERELARLAVGQTARLRSESLGGAPRQGKVLRVAPSVDPRSGTVKVTVDAPPDAGFRPGLYVEVELVIDRDENALLVPKRALVYDDTRAHVYRLKDDMTVERLRIEPLVEDERHVVPEAASTLAAGDRVIVAGQASLKDGVRVRLADTGEVARGAEPLG
ncbi:MAG: efflux RND transporter periplasmic adaptor subunit [Acidobacteriota bacterium]